jgi:myo-inositol-1(or 4)-monophosphatase
MQSITLENLCKEVVLISRETGIFFLDEIHKVKHSDIEEKGLHNFVSYVDKTAEQSIVNHLKKLLPEAGFITEEGTDSSRGDRYHWVIDPLDGTTNFLHHIPLYSISIALMDGDETILGVVHEPNLNECFYSWKEQPAFLNDNIIHVSGIDEMKDSLIATGFPYYDYGRLQEYINLFMHFARTTSGLRRLGSAAVDLAYTACGRFEAFYEYGLHPWDVAAGAFIVQQAGGKVSDFSGGNTYIFNGEMLASNGLLHQKLLEQIIQHFKTV